ncbi:hypothetical protein, partial [Bacteroides heparinolyticus]|uniref:hypothetical protein n=1 Tax=Prevotella heparinolytica TaxID=28113 RepID=UPI00359FADEB
GKHRKIYKELFLEENTGNGLKGCMTKESGERKRKGRKGRKGKGHIIIYTCARERGKGRLKDGSHAGGRRNTERRRDTGLNTKEE